MFIIVTTHPLIEKTKRYDKRHKEQATMKFKYRKNQQPYCLIVAICIFFMCFISYVHANKKTKPVKKHPTTMKAKVKKPATVRPDPKKTVKAFAEAMIKKDIKTFVMMWYEKEKKGKEKSLMLLLSKYHKPMKMLAKGMLDALKKKKNPFKKYKSHYKIPALQLPYLGISRSGKKANFKLSLVFHNNQWKITDLD
jgi:hypothetical protein